MAGDLGTSPLFVVAGPRGHRAEFRAALRAGGLVDGAGDWSGRDARLWLLGDYVDQGPDGPGVIDDVRRWTAQAAAAGGRVGALLGAQEARLPAAHRSARADLRGLTAAHIAWIAARPALAVVDGHLLMAADTTAYLDLGDSVPAVNAAVAAVLAGHDSAAGQELGDGLDDGGAFRDSATGRPYDPVSVMARVYGGTTLVHGHSTLIRDFGVAPGEVREPVRYAAGRVVAVDGGVHEGGRILLARLGRDRRN